MVAVTPEELSTAVTDAVRAAVDAGDLAVPVPDSVVVERPKSREHGDYATNVALRLAKPAGRPPRAVAELLATRLLDHPGIDGVAVAGPGFLNVTLAKDALAGVVRTVLEAAGTYGRGDVLAGRHLTLGEAVHVEVRLLTLDLGEDVVPGDRQHQRAQQQEHRHQ